MKNVLLLSLLLFYTYSFSQSSIAEKVSIAKVTQKKCLKKKGLTLVLKEVVSDSRCPVGLNCIWAGEATAIISLYKDAKLVEDNTMVFSMKNQEENKLWFCKYLPDNQKNLKSVQVLPYPSKDTPIDKKKYFVKVSYLK